VLAILFNRPQPRAISRLKNPLTLIVVASLLSSSGCWSHDGQAPTASISAESTSDASAARLPDKPRVNMQPKVEVRTSAGQFTLQLDAKKAPLTVQNFLSYVDAGHYNGTIFHQVFDGFIVLGGGFDSQFIERAAQPPVRNEAHNKAKNLRGTIAMARQPNSIDSATSQFFINLADNASLDFAGFEPDQYGYCVFGEVVSGMDVIDRIAKADVHKTELRNSQDQVSFVDNVPTQPVVIEAMRNLK
jgi:cyclophilin family peptidyl-prolyl cis-trans isomerase